MTNKDDDTVEDVDFVKEMSEMSDSAFLEAVKENKTEEALTVTKRIKKK